MTRNTLTISQTAHLIGMGRTGAYAAANEGVIAGVPVLRIRRRMAVPVRPLAQALGMTLEEVEEALADMVEDDDPASEKAPTPLPEEGEVGLADLSRETQPSDTAA